jgi:hypothetical protein
MSASNLILSSLMLVVNHFVNNNTYAGLIYSTHTMRQLGCEIAVSSAVLH